MIQALFELPKPPSVNQLWRIHNGKMILSTRYREWRNTAGWIAKEQKQPSIKGPYMMTVAVPETSRGDLDNLLKATCDLMQSVGVIENDKLAVSITITRSLLVAKGKVRVHLQSFDDVALSS